jgi:hypothetical protein
VQVSREMRSGCSAHFATVIAAGASPSLRPHAGQNGEASEVVAPHDAQLAT